MVDDPQELVLDHLRAIRTELADLKSGVSSMDRRMILMEKGIAGLRNEIALLHESYADHRYDYGDLKARVERIEARLSLVDQ